MEILLISTSLRRNKVGAVLIALQIALTVAIVCNTLSIVKQYVDQIARPSGIDEPNIFTLYNQWLGEPPDLEARVQGDLAALRSLPGVVGAESGSDFRSMRLVPAGFFSRHPDQHYDDAWNTAVYYVDEQGQAALGVKLIAGRWFRADEIGVQRSSDPNIPAVMIITQWAARFFFPDGNAVGQVLYLASTTPIRVIGVVERIETPWAGLQHMDGFVERSAFLPYHYVNNGLWYVVRTRPGTAPGGNEGRATETVRNEPRAHHRQRHSVLRDAPAHLCSWSFRESDAGHIVGAAPDGHRVRRCGPDELLGGAARAGRSACVAPWGPGVWISSGTSTLRICWSPAPARCLASACAWPGISGWRHRLALTRVGIGYITVAALVVLLLSQLAVIWPAWRAASISPRRRDAGGCSVNRRIMMLGYYLQLAIRSLRRNIVLTALMVAAVGVGIGASMTMLTTLVVMSSNPIPDKSAQLFVPQFDADGYATEHHDVRNLPWNLTYRDATVFMKGHFGGPTGGHVSPGAQREPPACRRVRASGRATYGDFFRMFEAPFRSGSAWGLKEDEGHDNVVVLSATLADRLFPDSDAVGRSVNLGKRDYRVIGVLRPWVVTPHFYDLNFGSFGETEDFYVPFSMAVDRQLTSASTPAMQPEAYRRTRNASPRSVHGCSSGWRCRVPSRSGVSRISWEATPRSSSGWAASSGDRSQPFTTWRSGWPISLSASGARRSTYQYDAVAGVPVGVPDQCHRPDVGEILRSRDGTERATRLGATRTDLFLQCVIEALLVGLLGGLLGLGLTAAGLAALRRLRGIPSADSAYGHLLALNWEMVCITFAVALVTTICCSLYPAYRASRVPPGWQLKAQ